MNINPILIIGIIALIFVFWLITKLLGNVGQMSNEEARQRNLIENISKQPNPSSGFSLGKLFFVIIVILLILGAIIFAGSRGFKFP